MVVGDLNFALEESSNGVSTGHLFANTTSLRASFGDHTIQLAALMINAHQKMARFRIQVTAAHQDGKARDSTTVMHGDPPAPARPKPWKACHSPFNCRRSWTHDQKCPTVSRYPRPAAALLGKPETIHSEEKRNETKRTH